MDMVQGHVLLADGAAHRDALVEVLRQIGYEVDVATDGGSALERLERERFDLLLLALETPHDRVYEVLERRRRTPALQSTPVVMVATPTEVAEIGHCMELGAEEVVHEPFSPALLRARLETCIAHHRLQEQRTELRRLEQLSDVLKDVILPLGISLTKERDLDLLPERILHAAKSFCNADGATLYLRTPDDRLQFSIMISDSLGLALGGSAGGEIRHAPLALYDPVTRQPNHNNVATYAALVGESVNIPDIYHAEHFDFSATRRFDRENNYRSVSTLTVPLKNNADEVIGVLQLLNALDPATGAVIPFDSFRQLVVEALASQASVAFNNRLLLRRQEELLRFERDLQIGRQIQAGFFPQELPEPAGWEVVAHFQPAREVAGDFYDIFELPGDRVGLVIADVCDKGVGAALFMALVRSLMRVFAQQRAASAGSIDSAVARATATMEAVELTNDYVALNHAGLNMFATLFFGVLDPGTGAITYVNGGHNPPMILGAGGVQARLQPTGPAVGMMPGFEFAVREVRLQPGEMLLAFTDGVTDARTPSGEFYGEPRLLALAERMARDGSASGLVSGVRDALAAHMDTASQYDDITMFAVRRGPAD